MTEREKKQKIKGEMPNKRKTLREFRRDKNKER